MAQKTKWICDGCSNDRETAKDAPPPHWKTARISWSGLQGYPASLQDGEGSYDLCPSCAKHLAGVIRPTQWPRHGKAEMPHG
jgi:hypothetical protein